MLPALMSLGDTFMSKKKKTSKAEEILFDLADRIAELKLAKKVGKPFDRALSFLAGDDD